MASYAEADVAILVPPYLRQGCQGGIKWKVDVRRDTGNLKADAAQAHPSSTEQLRSRSKGSPLSQVRANYETNIIL